MTWLGKAIVLRVLLRDRGQGHITYLTATPCLCTAPVIRVHLFTEELRAEFPKKLSPNALRTAQVMVTHPLKTLHFALSVSSHDDVEYSVSRSKERIVYIEYVYKRNTYRERDRGRGEDETSEREHTERKTPNGQ